MKRLFIPLIIFFLAISFFSIFAAEEKLTLVITPPLIKVNISPGDLWSSSVKIVNNNPKDLEIFASTMDFTSGKDGGVVFIPEENKKNGTSFLLSHWIEISPEPILIPAYQSRQVPFTIRVPLDAEPGGKYAAILVGTRPAIEQIQGAGIKITTLVSSLILANIRGEVIEEARIREFSTEKSFYQKPDVRFTVRVENIGNVHIQPQGEIKILNFWGKERGVITINHKTDYGNVLPRSTRKWNFVWKGEDSLLEAGRYQAVLTLIYGNEAKQTISRTIYFWVLPLVPTGAILGGILLFFIFITLFIRAYVKRAVFLAQREAETAMTPWPIDLTSGKARLSPRILKKPVIEAIDDFQEKKLKTKNKIEIISFLGKKYLFPILAFSIFVLGAVAVFFYFKDVLKESKGFEVIIEEMVSFDQAEISEKNELKKEQEFVKEDEFVKEVDINKESLSITVLNGSGISGTATRFAEKLEQEGFEILSTANADSFDYQETLIKYKQGKKKEAEFLNQFFENKAWLLEAEIQQEDLVIIIGKDLAI